MRNIELALQDVPELSDLLIDRARIVVAGESMSPALLHGDVVVVEPLRGRAPQAGEIVVYRREARWICHRVVRVEANGDDPQVITQGDAVTTPDAPVPLAHVMGRVTGIRSRRPRWFRLLRRGRQRLRGLAVRKVLTREEQVLQWSAWINDNEALRALEQLLSAPLDWPRLLQQARQQGVVALLADRLRRLTVPQAVPSQVQERLRQSYYQAVATNARALRAARGAMQALRDGGVRVVALKGFAMAERYYPDAALRPMQDVDVLVESAALPAAERILMARGFTKLRAPQNVYLRAHEGGVLSLEVHPPEEHPFYDLRAVLDRAQPVPGAPYALPTTEDLLIFSALHTTLHHAWLRLIWLHDLARIVADRDAPPDWSVVLERLADHPARFAMGYALQAAQVSCGAPVPAHMLQALAPRPHEQFRARVLAWVLAHPPIPRLSFLTMYLIGRVPGVSLRGLRQRILPSSATARQRAGRMSVVSLAAWYGQRMATLAWWSVAMIGAISRCLWQDVVYLAALKRSRR